MTKSELILRIGELNPHLYHRDVERIVSTIFDEISAALARGDRVELRGFGAFSIKKRDARLGRNPRTGAPVPRRRRSPTSRPASSSAIGSMARSPMARIRRNPDSPVRARRR